MSIPVDFKIDKIIKQIQKELKEELDVELEYDIILKCINHEIKSIGKGIENGDTVCLKYFASFVATQKRVDSLNKRYASIGKTPTLVDTGVMRMSFKRNGTEINESEFHPTSKKDLIFKLNK